MVVKEMVEKKVVEKKVVERRWWKGSGVIDKCEAM